MTIELARDVIKLRKIYKTYKAIHTMKRIVISLNNNVKGLGL